MKDRNVISKEYVWDLEVIYSDINAFYDDYNKCKELIDDLKGFENTMISNSGNFLATIKLYFDIDRIISKLSVYTSLSFDLDTSDNSKQELCEKVSNLRSDFTSACFFVVPSILKLDIDVLNSFYDEVPSLLNYKFYIDDVYRFKEHALDDNEEKLLSSMSRVIGNCYDTYELFKDCDMSFNDVVDSDGKSYELSNSSYSLFIDSGDRTLRRNAFLGLYDEYKKFSNTFASLLANNVKEEAVLAKIYKYDSAILMSLFADDVCIDVYDNLISSVHEKIEYIYDYYALKKKILGVSDLHLYDIYVPMNSEYDKKYSYEEAKEIIVKVLEVFGDEYVEKVKEGLNSRWIDVYPTKCKRTGGYSGGSYDTNPYILLNYQDKYSDMSTLIHEMGHSMHSYFSRCYNDYQNSEYRIFVAEVASTVNELLLSHYMLKNSSSSEERKFILNNLMELYKSTIYRQTMFAEFEKKISEMFINDEALTSDKLCSLYYDLNKFYFGDGVVVDDEIRYEWERIPHFYYNFYVYKYATGLSAATVIVNNILANKDGAVEGYIEFLKCGSKKSPLESLKLAGVDLTRKEVVTGALDEFKNILNMYKKETE